MECRIGKEIIDSLKACQCCGLIQALPNVPPDFFPVCGRCGTKFPQKGDLLRSTSRTAALSMASLILFPIAIWLPILRIERFGHHYEAGILEGCLNLLSDGHLFLAILIFICSVLFPTAKLFGLLIVSSRWFVLTRQHRAYTYRMLEKIGRWGMLDVLLVAVLVAAVKLSDLVEVTPGSGAIIFSVTVILSLCASACFDPHAIWEEQEKNDE